MGKYIGIDLGTTFSVAAYIDPDGKPQVIQNSEGNHTTPSAVLFEDGVTTVGEEARRCSVSGQDRYVAFAKRSMGSRSTKYKVGNSEYSPEEISAIVLKKIRQDVETALNDEILGAVVTVPAYFTEPQRKATMDAAQLAGIPVFAIINEPTAAALAYSYGNAKGTQQTFLIYDLGGGTFDVSICKIEGNTIEVLCSNGDHELGGYDFDCEIVKWFSKKAKAQGVDVEQDLEAKQELLIRAEEIKKALSQRPKANISVTVQGKRIQAELTRDEFNRLIEPHIYETVSILNETMEEVGIEYKNLDKILLVGGSTRIPLVRSMIQAETKMEVSGELHPDEVVAIGAAYHVINCIPTTQPEQSKGNATNAVPVSAADIPKTRGQYTFVDRTTHGIGVVTWNEELGIDENSIVLPKNTPMPAEAEKEFETIADYTPSILVTITEGEDTDMNYTTVIGEAELKLKPKPAHSPIRVIIACDTDSIIHVRVFDVEDQMDLGEMRIERSNNMSEDEIRIASNKIGKLNIGWEE